MTDPQVIVLLERIACALETLAVASVQQSNLDVAELADWHKKLVDLDWLKEPETS